MVNRFIKTALIILAGSLAVPACAQSNTAPKTDPVAENMLVYQRNVGGWPKAVGSVKVDYHKTLSDPDRMATLEDAYRNDATIDNEATNKEINYLVKVYSQTGNKAYLQAAEKGIRYLLKAQHANGGWPQYYPDTSLYRSQITYNDNAMINTLNVLNHVANRDGGFEVVDAALIAPSAQAVQKGIECILQTQVRVNGKLTGWCQQYDKRTMQPAAARKFELVGLSAMETVGILRFLMKVPSPSAAVKTAVRSGVEWLQQVQIKGYRFEHIADERQPTKRDAVLVADPNSVVWARYYKIENNQPFFSGRDGVARAKLTEVENERRANYAWYGTWAHDLLNKEYPKWATKNNVSN